MELKEKTTFLTKNINTNLEIIIYLSIGFLVPTIIGNSQLLVGIIINGILAIGAMRNITKTKMIAMSMAPSLGAITNGLLFGNLTNILIYFLPTIWISNMIYMKIIKENKEIKSFNFTTFIKRTKQQKLIKNMLKASVIKATILFTTAIILFLMNLIPKQILIAMSVMQLITATIGGGLAIGIKETLNKSK